MKPNPMLARIEAKYRARNERDLAFAMQLCGDIAMIAANEALGMGPGRAEKFARAYEKQVNEVGRMMFAEANSSRAGDIDYVKEKLDTRLQKICGDKFVPWEVRYKR